MENVCHKVNKVIAEYMLKGGRDNLVDFLDRMDDTMNGMMERSHNLEQQVKLYKQIRDVYILEQLEKDKRIKELEDTLSKVRKSLNELSDSTHV